MKKLIFIFFILISASGFSQKRYVFDYLIEYDDIHYYDILHKGNRHIEEKRESPEIHKVYYLTNSKDNSYIATLKDGKDSLYFRLSFRDIPKGIVSNVKVLKSDIKNAEFVNIDCKNIYKLFVTHNARIKKRQFFNLNDTIINREYLFQYKFYPTKERLTKKKSFRYTLYKVDKKTAFHLPIFFSSIRYNKWLLNNNLPMGMFKEHLFLNREGETLYLITRKDYYKVNLKIVISGKCKSNLNIIK